MLQTASSAWVQPARWFWYAGGEEVEKGIRGISHLDNSLFADDFADDDADIGGDGGLGEHDDESDNLLFYDCIDMCRTDSGCYYDDPVGVLDGGGLDDGGI